MALPRGEVTERNVEYCLGKIFTPAYEEVPKHKALKFRKAILGF